MHRARHRHHSKVLILILWENDDRLAHPTQSVIPETVDDRNLL